MNPSTGEDSASLQFNRNNTSVVSPVRTARVNRIAFRGVKCDFLRTDQTDDAHLQKRKRASWDARLMYWFQRKFFFCIRLSFSLSRCSAVLIVSTLNEFAYTEAKWEVRGVQGAWLDMPEPSGHQGALAGVAQRAWIPVELIARFGGGGGRWTRSR